MSLWQFDNPTDGLCVGITTMKSPKLEFGIYLRAERASILFYNGIS